MSQTPPNRHVVDVEYYHFGIDLPDTGSAIRGTAAIGFVRHGAGDDTLRLDLVGMAVDSVVDLVSTRPLTFSYDGRVLLLVVPRGQPGDRGGGVWVTWHGAPRDGLIIRPNARGRRSFFGDNWPDRARWWIPTVDDPADKAAVWWTVTAPALWQVVANGRFVLRADAGAGRIRWEYRENRPIPTYTMVIGAAPMTVSRLRPVVSGRDTIPVEVWAYPEDSAFADSVPFRRATQIVETMQRLVGPFPYEKLAHVESSTRYGGMENSAAIFYAEQMYVARRMGEGVVRHETAHQWFGDAVTARDFHQVWLSEGFASYFDLVTGAALDGDSVLSRGMRSEARAYLRSRDVNRPIIDTTVTDLPELLNANTYQKGSWVLHMLRCLVGDSAFWTGIRDYYRTYRDSSVTSADFQRAMERASGRRLGWFFDQWLRRPGYPQLDVAWSYDPAEHRVVLDIAQGQSAAWGWFRLPELTLEFLHGPRVLARRAVGIAAVKQHLGVDLQASPTDLRVDPDGCVLMTATIRRTQAGAR